MKINRCISCENEIEAYPCPRCGFDAAAYRQPEYALPCNAVLHGRYLIGKVLGQGGFGITYVGWDLVLQYKCAIKEYYPKGQAIRKNTMGLDLCWGNDAQTEVFRQTGLDGFLKEARKMNRVDHIPEVVRVRDTFIENETAYIVMDFVDGRTLQNRLEKDGILSWEDAKEIFFPVISAMEQVHHAGLIHRDLSPDNLMLLPDGGVKILDLGAAKDLSANSGASSMQVAKGGFSPIEQYTQRGGSGPWSDVYALAATLYYSLTGVLPPTSIDRLESDTLKWDLPQLKALPTHVQEALKKALTVLARDRIQSMGELLEEMHPPKKHQTRKTSTAKKEAKKESHLFPILAAAVVLALIGSLIFSLFPAPEKEQLVVPTETSVETPTVPIETEHVHSWVEATVSAPRHCTSCGEMSGYPVGNTVAAGLDFSIAVQSNGIPVTHGFGENGQLYVSAWKELRAVAAGWGVSVGLKEDGTVVAAGGVNNYFNDCVKNWSNIVAISAGDACVFGLKEDGTVLCTETHSQYGQHYVSGDDWTNIVVLSASPNHTVGLRSDGTVVATGKDDFGQCSGVRDWDNIVSVAAGYNFTLGLKADGTVLATWDSPEGNSALDSWKDIIAIDAGANHAIGLKADGTVVTAADTRAATNGYNQEFSNYERLLPYEVWENDFASWKDIVAISSSEEHTIGLKADGTVVTVAHSEFVDCDLASWSDIMIPKGLSAASAGGLTLSTPQSPVQNSVACGGSGNVWTAVGITKDGKLLVSGNNTSDPDVWEAQMISWDNIASLSLGTEHGVGLKLDGTVVSTGSDQFGQLEMEAELATWSDIVQVSAGNRYTMGLKADGTVLTAGLNNDNRYEVETWSDIVSIAAGGTYSVGLRTDGTVVTAGEFSGDVSDWTDITQISSSGYVGGNLIVGLRADGTVVATGDTRYGQCDVSSWKNIRAIAAGNGCTFGLTADGTIVCTRADLQAKIASQTGIISIGAGYCGMVGVLADGTAVSVAPYEDMGLNVDYWWGLRVPD